MTPRGASLLALKVAAVAASSAALLLASFYISLRILIFGNEIEVPDLRGQTVEESTRLLQVDGLYLESELQRYDPGMPAGRIITQTPAAGASTKPRRKVKVVVSLGTEVLDVPNLEGESERRAVLEIDRLGLRLGQVARVSTEAPVDRIIAQDPLPDSAIYRGDRISLLVSRGPKDQVFVMPDLTGQPLERVQRALERGGLRLGQSTAERSWEPGGTVLRQFPLAGYPVSRSDAITVIVSSGPSV